MSDSRSPLAPVNGGQNASESKVKFAAGDPSDLGSRSVHGSYFHPTSSSFSMISGSSKLPSHMYAEDLIKKGAKRKPTLGQSIGEFYASITHLHFGALRIVGDVEPLKLCVNLRVLYLYENRLTSLKGVGQLKRLTHLYAQDNRIADLSDFQAPAGLTQLFLSSNRLSLVEGLEGCQALGELHIDNQRPDLGASQLGGLRISEEGEGSAASESSAASEDGSAPAPAMEAGEEGPAAVSSSPSAASLSIAPASLMAIAPTLTKLVLHHNAVDDDALEPVVVLQSLTHLDVRNTQLESIARLQQLLVRLPNLAALQLAGNDALTGAPKFRERVIVATHAVAELDGKPIKASERAFLLQLAQRQASGASAKGSRRPSSDLPGQRPPAADGVKGEQRREANFRAIATQGPQQLGVSIPSAQSYNLGRGHGLVGELPAGFNELEERGISAALPSGTRRPWARAPHAV